MVQPLVSFIVTYYNLPVQMLCECIDSILALELESDEREIIVVDDGSEVSPINGLTHYGDEIIYVRTKNGGVSIARNTGMQMAHGQYIQFVDGDDYLIKGCYEYCLDIIRQHQDAHFVQFDFTHHMKEMSKVPCVFKVMSGIEYMHNLNIRGAAWCYIFKHTIRGSLEFTPGVAYSEDDEFTAQLLLRAEKVYLTEVKAYFYRKRSTSAVHQISVDKKTQRLDDTVSVILHLNELCDRLPPNEQSALKRRVAQLTMDYIYNVILITHSNDELNKRIDELKSKGLFPLPDRDYTLKYHWFRKMTNTSIGRQVLLHSLHLLKRER